MALHDLARMSVSGTPGTGTITLNAAVDGGQTFAAAGVVDGETVTYGVEDGSNREMRRGVYTASGTTLTRGTLLGSTTGSTISLTSAAKVFITPSSFDFGCGAEFLTSGTTWTSPANITSETRFKIIIVGGGGGGAGTAATANLRSAGGGAGGVGVFFISGLAPSISYTIAIGAAGAGGAAGANNGSAGTSTTITINGTTYTAAGGAGATTGATQNGGAGGGTTNIPAAPDGFSIAGQAGGAVATASTANISGNGGSSGLGFGHGGASRAGGSAADNGTGYGAGGGGPANGAATAQSGGNGTAGCILIEWVN